MRKHTKDTFDMLDQAAKDLLMELAQENIEWPEDHQPKHHPKKGGKYSCVAYDKRAKRYTTTDVNTSSQVPGTEIITTTQPKMNMSYTSQTANSKQNFWH